MESLLLRGAPRAERGGQTTTPAPARLVFMEATTVHVSVVGQYISALLR